MNTTNIPEIDPEPQDTRGLSIYGQQDAMDDFPVLKAFQQYIDAEQSKAHHRLMLLCIFFTILMGAVIAVFTVLLVNVSRRNDVVNDRLMEYMLRERAQGGAPMPDIPHALPDAAPPAENATMRAMADSITELKRQLAEQQLKLAQREAQARAAAEAVARPEPPAPTPAAETRDPKAEAARIAAERNAAAEAERLRREFEKIKAEREALAKEKARLHEKEIELQRRKLYPECYAPDGTLLPPRQSPRAAAARQAAPAMPAESPSLSRAKAEDAEADAEIARILAEGRRRDDEEAAAAEKEKSAAETAKPAKQSKPAKTDVAPKPARKPAARPVRCPDGSLRYFDNSGKDDDELDRFLNSLPVPTDDGNAASEAQAAKPAATAKPAAANDATADWDFPMD